MKFRYVFGNGESREIEVGEEWYDILISLDEENAKNDRTETRRHSSLQGLDYEGGWFAAPDADVFWEVLRRIDAETVRRALPLLTPCQQELVRRVFFLGERISHIASEECVSEAAIRNRLKKIYAKLKKVLF